MKDISYIVRMKEEKEELENKIIKMDTFMGKNANKIVVEERMLIYHQRRVMAEYIKVLIDRIKFAESKK